MGKFLTVITLICLPWLAQAKNVPDPVLTPSQVGTILSDYYGEDPNSDDVRDSAVQQLGCVGTDNGKALHDGCLLISAIDLTVPFHTPRNWLFVITQGPGIMNEWEAGSPGPAYLSLCFVEDGKANCDYGNASFTYSKGSSPINPHMFGTFDQNTPGSATIEYLKPNGGDPILVEQGINSPGIGAPPVDVHIWAYNPKIKSFKQIWSTFLDGLETIRFFGDGPLAGDVIVTVDNPTRRFPWPWGIDVYKYIPPDRFVKISYFVGKAVQAGLTPAPDAVVDIDMAEILKRLHASH